ncbi:hypothetical protein INR49_015669 [Scomber scombrus]|uniref:Uncharacterized protein n=1 Tax=Scomber scombrus TaxID=13677 RepID=A0AAV1N3E2_SCOSC
MLSRVQTLSYREVKRDFLHLHSQQLLASHTSNTSSRSSDPVCNGTLSPPVCFHSLGYLFRSRYLATPTKLRQRQWQQNITVPGEEDDSNKD